MFGLPYSLAQLTPPYAPSCNSVQSAVQTHIIYLPTDDEFLLFTRSKKHRSQYRAWSFEKALEGVESYILIIIKSSISSMMLRYLNRLIYSLFRIY